MLLLPGLGVRGDAHAGSAVQHRSRVAADPTQPNLRQVNLICAELHVELREQGFDVGLGQMGENVPAAGLDLLGLPQGTVLYLGEHAAVQVTELRNPCVQMEHLGPGMLKVVVGRDERGNIRQHTCWATSPPVEWRGLPRTAHPLRSRW